MADTTKRQTIVVKILFVLINKKREKLTTVRMAHSVLYVVHKTTRNKFAFYLCLSTLTPLIPSNRGEEKPFAT
jgi:hypothetical protein